MSKHWIILIAGGHSAGKKLVCKDLANALTDLANDDLPIVVEPLPMIDFSIDPAGRGPKNVDFDGLKRVLEAKADREGAHCITIVYGLYALYDEEIRDQAIMKVFVDSDADTRLSRWILRDVDTDQSKLGPILDEYLNFARPEMNEHVAPTKQFADVILPRGSEESGVQLISTGAYDRIREETSTDSHHYQSGITTPILGQSINLQRESYQAQSGRFYDLS